MLLGIQIIGVLFGLFMLYYSHLHHKKETFTSREWVVWSGLWFGFIILVIFPGILNPILPTLRLARAFDFFISLGFILFTAVIFYTYMVMRTNQRKVESLTTEIAFMIANQSDKNKKEEDKKE